MMPTTTNDMWPPLHDGLKSFIARRVQDQAAAEDILQEVFLRMHRRLDTLKDQRRFGGWLFQIARHAIIDYYRAPQRHREVPAGLAPDIDAAHPLPTAMMADRPTDTAQTREELAACLRPMMERLERPYRDALTLVELEGLTQAAAAKRLGLSPSGMKSRVQRGRRQLKRMLEECCVIQLDRRRSIAGYTARNSGCDPCRGSE
jgi:RNA polymerase sigma-70 factor (ECF subfamily)